MVDFLLGAVAMACAVAALLFFRYWRGTKDRLFLWFGSSFLVEALNRTHFAWSGQASDDMPLYYTIRLLSYGLILWAILEKNLAPRARRD